jgi:hypothetical protein
MAQLPGPRSTPHNRMIETANSGHTPEFRYFVLLGKYATSNLESLLQTSSTEDVQSTKSALELPRCAVAIGECGAMVGWLLTMAPWKKLYRGHVASSRSRNLH